MVGSGPFSRDVRVTRNKHTILLGLNGLPQKKHSSLARYVFLTLSFREEKVRPHEHVGPMIQSEF